MKYSELVSLIRSGANDEAIKTAVTDELLCAQGPFNVLTNNHENLLDVLSSVDRLELADELAIRRAPLLGQSADATQFVIYARDGRFAEMQALVEAKGTGIAKLSATIPSVVHSRDSDTALHEAAQWGDLEVLKWLISLPGVDVNHQENALKITPLQCAVFANEPEAASLLMAASANPHLKGFKDLSPIQLAVEAENEPMLVALEAPRELGYGLSSWMHPDCDESKAGNLIEESRIGGCRVYDTSPSYAGGRNEKWLASALAGSRGDAFISTKVGLEINSAGMRFNGSVAYLEAQTEKSFSNLGVDFIDLLILHRVDPVTAVSTSMTVLQNYKDLGRVGAVGLCTQSIEELREAMTVADITYLQVEYSPWTRNIETNGILQFCAENGITVMPCTPLGRGFFAGVDFSTMTQNPFVRIEPRFSSGNFALNDLIRTHMMSCSAVMEHSCSLAQLSLAWIWAKGDQFGVKMLPIPSTQNPAHLRENMASRRIHLSQTQLAELEGILAAAPFAGEQEASLELQSKLIQNLHALTAEAPVEPPLPFATAEGVVPGVAPSLGEKEASLDHVL